MQIFAPFFVIFYSFCRIFPKNTFFKITKRTTITVAPFVGYSDKSELIYEDLLPSYLPRCTTYHC